MKLIDMTGQRFGRLLVASKSASPRMWECLCDCGATKLVAGSNLRNKSIRSCGCLAQEWASEMGARPDLVAKRAEAIVKHGHKRRGGMTPEYRTWLGMKRRCYDKRCKDYPNWGGRGILVCDRWNESFESFFADMGKRPAEHTIDRIDPNGNYGPDNCRWATLQQQGAEHRRALRPVVVLGAIFPTVRSAANHHGISPSTAWRRLESGIDADAAFAPGRLKSRRTKESYLPKARR